MRSIPDGDFYFLVYGLQLFFSGLRAARRAWASHLRVLSTFERAQTPTTGACFAEAFGMSQRCLVACHVT